MRRSSHLLVFGILVATASACASAWPVQQTAILPGSGFGDTALNGAYRLAMLDGKPIPTEYPMNSGRQLVYQTLDLSDAPAARGQMAGKFSLRATVQPANDTVRIMGYAGRFALIGDTIRFDAGGTTPTWSSRFSWQPNGNLVLTDGANRWVYTRR